MLQTKKISHLTGNLVIPSIFAVIPLLRGNSDAYINQSNLRNFSAYIMKFVIEYCIEKQLHYLKKINIAYSIFSLIISHLMTNNTFVEHAMQKFQKEKYHVKLW